MLIRVRVRVIGLGLGLDFMRKHLKEHGPAPTHQVLAEEQP